MSENESTPPNQEVLNKEDSTILGRMLAGIIQFILLKGLGGVNVAVHATDPEGKEIEFDVNIERRPSKTH